MDRAKLKTQLNIDEGRRTRIYVDTVGKVTGGVGRNLTDRAFSDDEIELMLTNDVAAVEKELDLKASWWRQMSDARQNVLANMAFNMGVPTLLTFVNTLAAMKAARYSDAAAGMLNSKWAGQVGDRAKRLAQIMRTGEI